MTWRDVRTDPPPKDGTLHVRGLWVHSRARRLPRYWEVIAGGIDDTGDFIDHEGNAPWHAEDYTHWMPLPEPPKDAT